jgi:hypothetical protein
MQSAHGCCLPRLPSSARRWPGSSSSRSRRRGDAVLTDVMCATPAKSPRTGGDADKVPLTAMPRALARARVFDGFSFRCGRGKSRSAILHAAAEREFFRKWRRATKAGDQRESCCGPGTSASLSSCAESARFVCFCPYSQDAHDRRSAVHRRARRTRRSACSTPKRYPARFCTQTAAA